MSRLSHSFSVENAQLYGVECAILINHFQFWIEQNKAVGRNFHDGRTWMYQTHKEIAACYPYWSEDTIGRLIKKLLEAEVIIKGNFNKSKFDQTSWFAFKNEEIFTVPRNRGNEPTTPQNPNQPVAPPIPDTNPDAYPKKQQQPPAANAAVAASFYKELKDIDIPLDQKIEISKTYPIENVRHALLWVSKNDKPLRNGLAATLKWACKVKPELPKEKVVEKVPVNPEGYNRHYYREISTVASQNGYRLHNHGIRENNEYIETETAKIYYKDRSFLEQIANCIRKKSIECRNIFDMIKACQADLVKQLC